MIRTIRETGAEVLLVGVPQPAVFGLGTAEVYRKVAAESAVPLLDDALADILGDNSLKSDHIHPNAAGYAKLAEAIAALLRQARAI
jgi:acyl-CoA thioesterase I